MLTRALLVSLPLLALAGCPHPAPPTSPLPPSLPPAQAAPATPGALPHAWPPVKGQPFPELKLLDDTGATVDLADLRGKVLLVEAVGMSCPGCQAFTGGHARGGFGGVAPQAGLPSIDDTLRDGGVDPGHPDLALVQVLFYDLKLATPGVSDARAWVEHFGLRERRGTFVLVGDDRYRAHPATYGMVPGFFVVDRDGTYLLDATNQASAEDRAAFFPTLQRLLGGAAVEGAVSPTVASPPSSRETRADGPRASRPASSGALADPATFPERERWPEAKALRDDLANRRWDALEAKLVAGGRAGRIEGSPKLRSEWLVDCLSTTGGTEGVTPEDHMARLDAWVAGAPRSPWARASRGSFLISWAWSARGSGFANTVSSDGWRLYSERLQRALPDLQAALRLDPACEPALIDRMTLAYGMSVDDETAASWFKDVTDRPTVLVQAYWSYLQYLAPKWHGCDGRDMWAFARGAVRDHPDEPALKELLADAHEETARGQVKEYWRVNGAEILALRRAAAEAYPEAVSRWTEFARVALNAGDREARQVALQGAARLGDGHALMRLAFEEKDPARARPLYWRAAHAGNGFACAIVGGWFVEGEGVERDPVEGVRWLELGAETGEAEALYRLGDCLLAGRGTARDPARAIELLRRAGEKGDESVKRYVAQRIAEAEYALRATTPTDRKHADGFEDWYPDDVSAPPGTQYPCALSALPRAMPGIPARERRFVNHMAALLLRACRARLVCWRELGDEEAQATYAAEVADVKAKLLAEPLPRGLEGWREGVVAALDLQVVFHAKMGAGVRAERTRLSALRGEELVRRYNEVVARLMEATTEGRQGSQRLIAAWGVLEGHYGRAWAQEVRDSLFHHHCALDLY